MAYVDTPIKTDSKSKSQGEMRTNFSLIKTTFDQDHEDFDTVDAGKHKQVLFTEQATSTSTSANEVALYAKDNSGSPNLYLRNESDGTEFNLTPDYTHTTTGYEVLPSGLVINWGSILISSGSTSNSIALAKSISSIYGFSYGARSSNVNITTAKNTILVSKSVAAGNLTITRGGDDDAVTFDFILLGK